MEYADFSMTKLKELAKSLGVERYSSMRKPELLQAIGEKIGPSAAPAEQKPQAEKKPQAEQKPQMEQKPQAETEKRPQAEQRPQMEQKPQTEQKPQAGAQSVNEPRPRYSPVTRQVNRTRGIGYGSATRISSSKNSDATSFSRSQGEKADPSMADNALDTTGKLGMTPEHLMELDSGVIANGILEVMPDGYGFIRCENFLPGEHDIYVAPSQIRKFNLKTGDMIYGGVRVQAPTEKFAALLYIRTVNGFPVEVSQRRPAFEDLTPVFPNSRIRLEMPGCPTSLRIVDLLSPIGKGQRGMIVAPPKAGKTTLLKQIAGAITKNHPEMHLIVLLIDERPEEVTDIKEAIEGPHAEVIYSTFDELPEHHKRVSEMVIERGKRLVEHGKDVAILLDSITRLSRAYNLTVAPSGRTLSGGLDPAALYAPKRFFGAARNMRQGGSLTILATALVDTGSRMDDVVFEEFKGTGNMELVLNRKLSEKRIFPAIDIGKSSTRNEDLLLSPAELEAIEYIRRSVSGLKGEEAAERVVDLFAHTKSNEEFIQMIKKTRLI